MSPEAALPLGASSVGNLASTTRTQPRSKHVTHLVDSGKENRKDGHVEIDKASSAEMIRFLQRDLERAHAKILRRDETISKLSKSQVKHVEADTMDMEDRLQELIKQYEISKTKHKHELEVLRASQQELSKENRSLRRELQGGEAKAKEIEELQAEIRGLRSREGESEPGRGTDWLKEKHELERMIFALKREVSSGSMESKAIKREMESLRDAREKSLEQSSGMRTAWDEEKGVLDRQITGLEAQVVKLGDQAEQTAEAFERMRMDSVRWDVYAKVRDDLSSERIVRFAREGEAGRAKASALLHQEETECMKQRLSLVEKERDMLSGSLHDLLHERQQDQMSHSIGRDTVGYEITTSIPSDNTEHAVQLLDVAITHNDFSTAYHRSTLHSLQSAHRSLLKSHESLEKTYQALITAHDGLTKQLVGVTSDLAEAERSHRLCDDEKLEMKMYAEDARQERDMAEGKSSSLEEDIKRLGLTIEMNREALKRANEGTTRWRAAESALLDDIARLEADLQAAQRFEELYNELVEEHWIVVSREAAASEEVARVGHQNAELVGHVNGDQKINYVESLRRDMALMRAELASTRMKLNVANDRVRELGGEVAAYKAIDEGLGASIRTRVVRRQPEGGMLSASTRGRSVSGPSGRMGR